MSVSEILKRDRERKKIKHAERDSRREQKRDGEQPGLEQDEQQQDEQQDEERERRRKRRRQLRAQGRERARATAMASGQRRVLRIAEVEAVTGRARSQIYAGVSAGEFPEPVPLGERAVGWLSDEVQAWVAERIAARAASKQPEPA
jgi:prophage regulatory protein